MIKGIGTDIIEIDRVAKAMANGRFMSKCYTQKEISYISSKGNEAETAAAVFCAKEAVAKALGTGFSGFSPRDVEITRNEMGKPEVTLYDKAKKTAEAAGIFVIHVSLTHCRDHAAAFAVAEGVD